MEILCPDAEFDRAVTRYTDFGVSFWGSCGWSRSYGLYLGRPTPLLADSMGGRRAKAAAFQEMAAPVEARPIHPLRRLRSCPRMAAPTGIWSTPQQGRSRGLGWLVRGWSVLLKLKVSYLLQRPRTLASAPPKCLLMASPEQIRY